jgi:hypothetical protein
MRILKWPLPGYRRFLTWAEKEAIREGRAPHADVLSFPKSDTPASRPAAGSRRKELDELTERQTKEFVDNLNRGAAENLEWWERHKAEVARKRKSPQD